MTEEITNYHYWQYFLTLETDLITTSRYIEFTGADVNNKNKNNAETFSPELLRIFFAACAECENIAKILAKTTSGNIETLRETITHDQTYRTLPNHTISCPVYSLDFTPWKAWEESKTPEWWTDHNSVKHGRETNYHLANLSNTLNSMAALLCLLFEYYKKEDEDRKDENFIYYVVAFPPALATKLFITDVSGLGFGNGNWCWSVKEEKEPNS